MLIAIIIGSIAMLALATPFLIERKTFVSGIAQVESQRDAHLVLQAIAREGRAGGSYTITGGGTILTFREPDGIGCKAIFSHVGDQLQWDQGCIGAPIALIDGGRNKVLEFTLTEIIPNKLVHILLNVEYDARENEILETEIYLRNA